jgi:hypothetical protein
MSSVVFLFSRFGHFPYEEKGVSALLKSIVVR